MLVVDNQLADQELIQNNIIITVLVLWITFVAFCQDWRNYEILKMETSFYNLYIMSLEYSWDLELFEFIMIKDTCSSCSIMILKQDYLMLL